MKKYYGKGIKRKIYRDSNRPLRSRLGILSHTHTRRLILLLNIAYTNLRCKLKNRNESHPLYTVNTIWSEQATEKAQKQGSSTSSKKAMVYIGTYSSWKRHTRSLNTNFASCRNDKKTSTLRLTVSLLPRQTFLSNYKHKWVFYMRTVTTRFKGKLHSVAWHSEVFSIYLTTLQFSYFLRVTQSALIKRMKPRDMIKRFWLKPRAILLT